MHHDVARMAIDAAALNLVIAVVMLPLSYGLSVLFFRVLVALEKNVRTEGVEVSKPPGLKRALAASAVRLQLSLPRGFPAESALRLARSFAEPRPTFFRRA